MSRSNIKKILSKFAIFVLIFGVLCTPFSAFAVDLEFVDNPLIWKGSEYDINGARLESIDGYYQYYFDEGDSTVYFHIMYYFEELASASDIEIGLQIDNPVHSYDFTFCNDTAADYVNNFNIYPAFSNVEADGQEIFFAIEFLDKNDKKQINDITVNLLINRLVYPVCKSVKLSFQLEDEKTTAVRTSKPTTTRPPKTTKPTTQRAVKATTQKSAANSKFKASAETSTKFKYEGNADVNAQNEPTFGTGAVVTDMYSYKSALSLNSKICIIIAAVFFVSGTALIIHSRIKSKSEIEKDDDN